MRIVLDANILVRANPRSAPHGLARELLLTCLSEPHSLVMSAPILTESRRVLSYPHVAKRWPLNSDVIDQYVSLLSEASDMVDMPSSFPALISDPDDDPILQTAIQGHADILCTRDAAFSHDVVREACQAHGIRLLDDIALMHELRLAKKQIGVHFRAAA